MPGIIQPRSSGEGASDGAQSLEEAQEWETCGQASCSSLQTQ